MSESDKIIRDLENQINDPKKIAGTAKVSDSGESSSPAHTVDVLLHRVREVGPPVELWVAGSLSNDITFWPAGGAPFPFAVITHLDFVPTPSLRSADAL